VPRRKTKGMHALADTSAAFSPRRIATRRDTVLNMSVGSTWKASPSPHGTVTNPLPCPSLTRTIPFPLPIPLQHDGHFVPVHALNAPVQLSRQGRIVPDGVAQLAQHIDAAAERVGDVPFVHVRPFQQLIKGGAPTPPV